MKSGAWFMRITAGRHAGAAVLFKCTGATKAECEQQIADNAGAINEAYEAVRAGLPTLETIAGLLDAWERSADFEAKSLSTKQERSRVIAAIKASPLGKARASFLKQAGATGVITKQRDKWTEAHGPRAADYRIEVLSRALAWHLLQGNIARNPAAGIADVYQGDRSDLIWEPEHVEAYRAHIKAEIARVWASMAPGPKRHRMVAKLVNAYDVLTAALNSGMRRTDLSLFAWIWIRDGAIIYTPQKGRNRARTAKRPARTVVLPLLPEMAAMLIRRREAASGPRVFGQYTRHSLGHLVSDVTKHDAVRIDRHLHDTKGTFVTRLKINTDLTDEEIAGLVDWSVANVQSIIRSYVSGAAVSAALLKRFRRA